MNYKPLAQKGMYSSSKDDFLKQLFNPFMKITSTYRCYCGEFSFELFSQSLLGITEIVKNDGKIYLLINQAIDDELYNLLLEKQIDDDELHSLILRNLEELEIYSSRNKLFNYRYGLLKYLLSKKHAVIKICFSVASSSKELICFFTSECGERATLLLSKNSNERNKKVGLLADRAILFLSEDEYVYEQWGTPLEEDFKRVWSEESDAALMIVKELPLKSKLFIQGEAGNFTKDDVLLSLQNEVLLEETFKEFQLKNIPIRPSKLNGKPFELFDHQKEAIRSFFSAGVHNGQVKGLLKLATGAGKTITALSAVTLLFEKNPGVKLFLIVSVPYIALAEQWEKDFRMFNMLPIKCYDGINLWYEELVNKINSFLVDENTNFFSVIVVNATLKSEAFQKQLNRIPASQVFFVGDECHHHAQFTFQHCIPDFQFKLGLSATPYNDSKDTGFEIDLIREYNLKNIYGDVVHEYGLADALADDILAPYNYYVSVVNLTETESEEYIALTKKIASFLSQDASDISESCKALIRQRNNIISNSSNKKNVLTELLRISPIKDKSLTLFYVGEGLAKQSEDEAQEEIRQLDLISKELHKLGWKSAKFTALESKRERLRILSNFKNKEIDALISMRVLDEGIDIPACKRAFILASSTNSRQFIQRRGRVLRKAPGKTIADIYDFIVLPNKKYSTEEFDSLVRRELSRVFEFTRLSSNRIAVEESLYYQLEQNNISKTTLI